MNNKRHYTEEKKAEIVLKHLVDGEAVSAVCESYQIKPNMFYRWLAEFKSNASAAFKKPDVRKKKAEQRKLEQLESELQKKDSIIAYVTTELMISKKKNGVI